ncbi:MAG: ABC transporter substrate-binding protein [Thermoanaerobacteraceae bacterium]|nr:ABC transporter substrate-binding protein [Thermoanaerobacteraceae bacterium]
MKKSVLVLLVLAIVVSLFISGCSNSNVSEHETSNESASITFTDIVGREVHMESLPQKFVVANYIANFLMVGGAESLDKVVGMTFDGWEDTRYGEYKVFTDAFPRMLGGKDGIVSIGGYHDDVLNTELILSLSPDVILMSNSQFIENNQHILTFEQAGIDVVVLDYHAQKLENHTKSTEILGKLLGREEVAQEQIDAYVNAINDVKERIASLPDEKKHKKVYVELGNKGVGEYGNSYNNNMLWGAIVNNIGADNLGAGLDAGYGVLDKEFVITSNPDVIFIGGAIWSGDINSDQMRMGFTIDESIAQERLRGFANRPDWQDLNAVKNGEVYGVDHGSLRNMIDYTFTQYMAKVLYPDLFKDIDPEKTINEYYAKYLPELKYTGTFMTKLK